MPEQIILAQDAVFVSEENALCNYADTGKMKVGFSEYVSAGCGMHACAPYPFENIGLVQFAPFQLPQNTRLVKAVLHLFVLRSRNRTSCIWLRSIPEPFDGGSVNWVTRPPVAPAPALPLLIHPENRCGYVSCDITQLLPQAHAGCAGGFGVALSAGRETMDWAVLSASQTAYPVYGSILYEPCENTGCPASGERVENVFHEEVFHLEGAGQTVCTQSICAKSAQTVTFFVKNTGVSSFHFHLQISPDGAGFTDDKQTGTLQAGEMQAFTPYLFARFMRICVSPSVPGEAVQAQVWCQMQTRDYMVKG